MLKTRVLASAVFIAAGLLAAPQSSYAAGGGYGSGNGPTGVPGGYAVVVTTHTFDAVGGSLIANIPGGQAVLMVPPGAFVGVMQVVVTAPDLGGVEAALPKLGLANHHVVAAIGVQVNDTNGHKFAGTFGHALTLTVKGIGIGVGDRVIQFTSASTAVPVAALISSGVVTVELLTDPDFAVLAPATAVAPVAVAATPSATAASSAAAPSSAPASSAAAVAPAAATPPSQVLGEQFTRSSQGYSLVPTTVAVAILVLLITGFVAMRRRPAPSAYASKHRPRRADYTRRHGPHIDTHAPRH
jgi:hypothetical protein